jgi:nuclear pore complex protein Nup160
MATHPWPTDIGHIWTLSRDRNLRFWKAKLGCVATKTLSSTFSAGGSTPVVGTSANDPGPRVLLDAEHQTLLRVFTTNSNDKHIFVLVFVPTTSSSTSGGSFQLVDTFNDHLYEVGAVECSNKSAHCHLQDFMMIGATLYTLWDRQGQSMVETTPIKTDPNEQDSHPALWQTASYAQESELTPAYLEELLLSPGSLTDKFFEAIMRPGMFSTLTLRTAIDQYTNACLSLPGPPPPQLTTIYATLGENIAAVVGCTVNLIRDPLTGALQHAKYWNALKRDWEGFIARCRDVERNARWPLVLGAQDQGDIIIVERERVGSLVAQDLPIHLRKRLAGDHPHVEAQYDLLDTLWRLRTELGPQFMLNIENRLLDVIRQEIAFSFADILQDQARRCKFKEEMDEGLASWIVGRLQRVDNIDLATRTALDVIGGFDMVIKREEDEVELLLPQAHSEWARALTATYVTTTVNARYDLCLSLVTLLFFLADGLWQWDPSLLAEIFAVFRGIAILRFVTRQPAKDSNLTGDDNPVADDVISRMRNMQVSRNRTHFSPTYSLIHRLLAQSSDPSGPLGAAHRFIDATGLLQSVSPAYATKYEILFCERLRLLGYHEAAREILSWLPRTAGATYVLARLWLDVGRADDASYLLEKLAGSFGTPWVWNAIHVLRTN